MRIRNLLLTGTAIALTACSGGGGGGGSSPSTAVPQYIKTPKVNCGSKDCFSGATISSQSIGTMSSTDGDSAYSEIKNSYSGIKDIFKDSGKVGYAVQLLNAAANENDIASCGDIPTSGTFSFGGYNFTLAVSSEQWNISGGSDVAMTHKITAEDNYTKNQYNFNCDSTVQRLHIISEQSNVSYKFEIYSEVNLTTGEAYIQVGEISGADKSLIYFSSNGGDKFTLAKFATVGSLSLMATSDVLNPPTVNPESQYVEVVRSASPTDNLDAITTWGLGVDSGHVANTYRGCISGYRSSPIAYDNSCNVSDPTPSNWTTKYALLSNLEDLKVGDLNAVTDWSVVGLSGLVIPNP